MLRRCQRDHGEGSRVKSDRIGSNHSQGLLPGVDLVDGDLVEHTVDTGVDQRGHDLGRHATGRERGPQKNRKRDEFLTQVNASARLTGCTGAA